MTIFVTEKLEFSFHMVLKVDLKSIISFLQDLTLKEAETIALSILKQVMEEKVSNKPHDTCIFMISFLVSEKAPPIWFRWLPIMLILRGYLQLTIYTHHRRWKRLSAAYKKACDHARYDIFLVWQKHFLVAAALEPGGHWIVFSFFQG